MMRMKMRRAWPTQRLERSRTSQRLELPRPTFPDEQAATMSHMLERTRHRLVLLSALLLVTTCLRGAPEDPTTAAAERISPERITDLVDRLETARAEHHLPGLSLALVHRDEVILTRGFGERRLEDEAPVTEDTLFAIGSTSEAFTAALIGMLVDEGRLGWEDRISQHLPGFRLADERANAEANFVDLLTHRVGLTRMPFLWSVGSARLSDMLPALARARPMDTFRECFLYNNVLYLVAGEASARAAGEARWSDLLEKRILKPLGMSSSNTSVKVFGASADHALGYSWKPTKGTLEHLPMRDLTQIAPAGAINSNAIDMAKWLRFLLARGQFDGERLISEEQFDRLLHPENVLGPDVAYGLGWIVRKWRGRELVEHSGNIDGFAAHVAFLPDERLGFSLMTNVTVSPLLARSAELVFETLLEAPQEPEEPDAESDGSAEKDDAETDDAKTLAELERYLGKFHMKALKADLTVLVQDGRLALDVPGQTTYVLEWPDEDDKWFFELTDSIAVSFTKGDGPVESLTLYQGGLEFVCPRIEETVSSPEEIDRVLSLHEKAHRTPAQPGSLADTDCVHLKGKLLAVHQGVEGDVEMWATLDGERCLTVIDLGIFGRVGSSIDGARTHGLDLGKTLEEETGANADAVRAHALSSWFLPLAERAGQPRLGKPEEVEGVPCEVLSSTSAGGIESTHWIDAKSGRLVQEETQMLGEAIGPITIELRYERFETLGRHRVPFRIRMKNPFTGVSVLEIDRFEKADFPQRPLEKLQGPASRRRRI